MLQAIVKKGKVLSETIPVPDVQPKTVLIRVVNSCISTGTEISRVSQSGKPLLKKVLEQPERMNKAINLLKTQGLASLRDKLDGLAESAIPIGYSVAGIVIKTGSLVTDIKPGDNVAAAGTGYANHAEIVSVPASLVVKMPEGITFSEASTVAVGAIALHGVRRTDTKIGEFCVVVGAGIMGLLSIQILKSSGVRVAAIDLDEKRLDIAKELGAEICVNPASEDPVKTIGGWTGSFGTDVVLFTAATSSNEPLSQAFRMCKRKGKVVLVGVAGMTINREDIYEREIDFQISTSYGPGRYDKGYEEECLDYPYAYVRWTENRNMSEYLRLLKNGSIRLEKLITATYPVGRITEAFESLQNSNDKPIITLIDYGNPKKEDIVETNRVVILPGKKDNKSTTISIALVGAGNFATGVHLPNIRNLSDYYTLRAVMDQNGLIAQSIGSRFGAAYATTDFEKILNDSEIDLIMITTRHRSHAELSLKALEAGKHVFVEKPLAINEEQLKAIESFYLKKTDSNPVIMVGFNRRFSKYALEIKKHTDQRINPLIMHYRMNAGFLPRDHWVHEDGGRIIGECCHIIDLMSFIADSQIVSISCESMIPATQKFRMDDNKIILLKYKNGSIGTIEYFSTGSPLIPKEFFEVHFDEKTIILDDYKKLHGFGVKIKTVSLKENDKGHLDELEQLYRFLKGNEICAPISLQSMIDTTRATFIISQEK
jgi:predicted dehydrogenase/threonine dehydrogenase-like Zn-dependent dehydrogenase